MKELIEKFKDKKAQIAGAIIQEESLNQKMGEESAVSSIDLLELQADILDDMMLLAQELSKKSRDTYDFDSDYKSHHQK